MAEPDTESFKLERKGQRFACPDGRDLLELAEAEGFSVSGVADELQLTNRQLEYAVERVAGLRPKELFRRQRMLLARRLVAEGYSLQVIAQRLGFKHYTHFASEVKSYFNLPPRQFQKSVRAMCPET
ncbi:MAG: helix-turn-helix domain-containing protein [Verrucomicrobia bacterium]|nr:helix-turn-helix domain-containing protein [Verrucomicrobiota bacterium]